MKRLLIVGSILVLAGGLSGAGEQKVWLHAPLDRLLRDHVKDGVVDYAALAKNRAALDGYVATLAKTKLEKKSRDEKLAYWINAYNAFTLRLILEKYPKLKSIRDLEKPWDTKKWKAAGKVWSLNDIEHRVIRKEFDEPRIHFALVCAAKSCPNLRSEAWSAKKLERQLKSSTLSFLANRKKGVKVHAMSDGKRTVELSALFDWYGDDFRKGSKTVIDYIYPYLLERDRELIGKQKKNLRIKYLPYDWSLNGS